MIRKKNLIRLRLIGLFNENLVDRKKMKKSKVDISEKEILSKIEEKC